MREYAKKPESPSRTLESNPKASRQAPIDVILQQYTDRNIQRYAEDKGSIQGKFNTVQREETDKNELLQGKFESVPAGEQKTVQREEKPNNTGLPDSLKSGIENLSGYSMDDVRVHYNSSKPAQLNALAYAQGTDIHVAPGQEKHLSHEAWHVVQQKQGRVQPTMQMQGLSVNDNEELEKEADYIQKEIGILQKKQNSTKSIIQMRFDGPTEYELHLLSQGLEKAFNWIRNCLLSFEANDAILGQEFSAASIRPANQRVYRILYRLAYCLDHHRNWRVFDDDEDGDAEGFVDGGEDYIAIHEDILNDSDRLALTIIHEATHLYLNTEDNAYFYPPSSDDYETEDGDSLGFTSAVCNADTIAWVIAHFNGYWGE